MELAHVSDLHFRSEPGGPRVGGRGYLNKRVVGWLNLTFNRTHPPEIAVALAADLRTHPPDHLAVTGDLTNLALPAELEASRRWLELLHLPPERVSVIPGNHDTYVRAAQGTFEQVLADWVAPAPHWPRAQRVGDLLLIGTTSCVPTPWFRAWGTMGATQLEQVAALLEQDDAPLKAVLVHHPPLLAGGRPEKARRGNRDAQALLDVCRGAADMILCGHTHRAFAHEIKGERPLHVFCAGSTTSKPVALGRGATYNRYRIKDGRLLGYEVRGFDPQSGAFAHVRDVSLANPTPVA